MFKDYYQILGLSYPVSKEDIKKAYHNMSLQWHPDKNQNENCLQKMQDINEAYAILKDDEKKIRYDKEYLAFRNKYLEVQKEYSYKESNYNTKENGYYEYDINDETLKDDIKEAREYSKRLVEEFVEQLKINSQKLVKGARKGVIESVRFAIGWIISGIILAIIAILFN